MTKAAVVVLVVQKSKKHRKATANLNVILAAGIMQWGCTSVVLLAHICPTDQEINKKPNYNQPC